MDGIDVALVETDGHAVIRPGPGRTLPYPPELRRDLQSLLLDPSIAERDPLTALDARVTQAFADAISTFMDDAGIVPEVVDLIGLHGQTIYHRPERRFTRQLGQGSLLAGRLRIPVVDAFRQADVASGGHGAPFAPLYHAALATPLEKPVMVLNLGGVANVTYIDGDTILAFDTGPASALIDDLIQKRLGQAYDDGGRVAASGTVDRAVLACLMDNPYFTAAPPKSLDRQDFHVRAKIVEELAAPDAVATLAAFTIEATVAALAHLPASPRRWLVTGGGRRNLHLMRGLAERLGVPVDPVEHVGWNGDLLEAQCFGYLAVRSRIGLPLSLPTTTGVPHPMPGGIISEIA
jgi:anhydro-N-acetylmuramic acid kinase